MNKIKRYVNITAFAETAALILLIAVVLGYMVVKYG